MRLYTFADRTQAKSLGARTVLFDASSTMTFSTKIRTIFRGEIAFSDLPREYLRRKKQAKRQQQERLALENINDSPARLVSPFASLSAEELLKHFRERNICFFPAIEDRVKQSSEQIIADADRIVNESRWELAGLGLFEFVQENFWRRDPVTGKDWGTDYHTDVVTYADDGADIRVLWELNRFGHAVSLACAYSITDDECYAETFFSHVESWIVQNPYGGGANWNCAMEVALRAINLLAAFDMFRKTAALTEKRLAAMLKLFDQHGRFILNNDEFSYISTSNHYLSDVIGLFWIGTMIPELDQAAKWNEFGIQEMLREMDKQILPDGADFEASTGYHKFVTEMFLYSFILADRCGVDIQDKYLEKLRGMLWYLRNIMRPDGCIPLIGDADGSQIIPIVKRDADDVAYLLSMGAQLFKEPELITEETRSIAARNAGSYILRDGDLYLHFNTNDCGLNGRGSHGHNDALSIEISAFGRPFIIDPGSYVYNLDRVARHTFRSTAYHSTVMIDDEEQNTTDVDFPFVIGNEARPVVDECVLSVDRDSVSAKHFGYTRLKEPLVHRRTVELHKKDKYLMIEDTLIGQGHHKIRFSFHLAPGISVSEIDRSIYTIGDKDGRKLYLCVLDINERYCVEPAFVSRTYGSKESSSILKWETVVGTTFAARFFFSTVPFPSMDG